MKNMENTTLYMLTETSQFMMSFVLVTKDGTQEIML